MAGREYVEPVAFESMRALVEIAAAEDYLGTTQAGERFEKANFDYKVVSYEEQDEDDGEWIGEVFTDGAYYKNGGVPPRGKLPNTIIAAKGEKYFDDLKAGRITFEPEHLVGCRLRAQVEISEKGYSTLVWNTIGPEKKPRASRKAKKAAEALEEQNAKDLQAAEDASNPLLNEEEKAAS
jgi:hypothetical protein